MKIRGTKLTVAQKKVLKSHRIKDIDSYLLKKIIVINENDDSLNLSKESSKLEKWQLIHRTTGELIEPIIRKI